MHDIERLTLALVVAAVSRKISWNICRAMAQIYLGGSAFSASQASSGFHEGCVTDKCLECCCRGQHRPAHTLRL